MPQRKIILNLCTSLDGYIEGAQGEIDWCYTDQDYGMTAFLESVDTIFFGRHSYKQLLEMAPEAFADKQKVVFSTTLSATKDIQVLSGDVKTEVLQILAKSGKNIWLFGGAQLINSLLELGLVDEMMVAVHPLLLGSGKSLVGELSQRVQLELKDTITYSTGLVQLIYGVV
ncbi:MAG: dihydrofolate reductase family protein [Bacteroidota bacterium]